MNYLSLLSTSMHACTSENPSFLQDTFCDESGTGMSIEEQVQVQAASQNYRVMKYSKGQRKHRQNDTIVHDENFISGGQKATLKFNLPDCDRDTVLAPITDQRTNAQRSVLFDCHQNTENMKH